MIQFRGRLIQVLLYGVFILIAILSIGSLYWRFYPLELLSSFRVYYLIVAGVIAIAAILCQLKGLNTKILLYCSLGLIAFNSAWVVPWYLPHAQQEAGTSLRALTFNINTQNDQWDSISNAIRSVQPDVATVIETSLEAKAELSLRLNDLFPFVYRTTGGGLTILSRYPLIAPHSQTFDNGTILITTLEVDQSTVELIAAHLPVPVKPTLFKRRNGLLAEISTYLQQNSQKSFIFLGDMNLTPWSPHYSQFMSQTGLHNTRLGFGIEPSWVEAATHVRYPRLITALVKIPIDHIFVSPNLKVSDCETQKAANSDHRMLWSDLVLS